MNTIPETTFGKSLKMEREGKQLTQTQLAVLVGTSQQNIAGMEAGRSLPKEAIFDKLVEVFGKHSSVAQLPPRGVIKLGHDTLERIAQNARAKAAKTQATLSPKAQELGELFDMLPPDRVTREAAYRECTGLLLPLLDSSATPKVAVAPQLAHKP